MALLLDKRIFTVDEYHMMAEVGILHEDDRLELIEGEIVKMAPIGSRHAACTNKINRLLSTALGGRAIVSIKNPLPLSEKTEAQPDITLLKHRSDFYAERHPEPADVLLVIEVADTSLAYDRDIKMPQYARAGIPKAWLVDLASQQLLSFLDPTEQAYGRTVTRKAGKSFSPSAFSDITFTLNDLLL